MAGSYVHVVVSPSVVPAERNVVREVAPFGGNASERVVGAEDCIAVRVCGGDAVAEEVVGVGFGDGVDAVGVGVRGEEVAVERIPPKNLIS